MLDCSLVGQYSEKKEINFANMNMVLREGSWGGACLSPLLPARPQWARAMFLRDGMEA